MPNSPIVKRAAAADTTTDRFIYLVEALWRGNRSRAAEELGCSHTAVSRVLTGKRPLGARLLKLVTEHSRVNPLWIMSGEGEPLLAERSDDNSEGWPLPVVTRPLPGTPSKHRALLTGQTFPVPGIWASATRYWLQISGEHRAKDVKRFRIAIGDRLLVETDVGDFRRELRRLYGRLGIVNVGTNADLRLELVRFDADETGDAAVVTGKTLGGFVVEIKTTSGLGNQESEGRAMVFDDEEDGKEKSKKDTKPTQSQQPLHREPNSLVGVAVALVRLEP